MVVNHTDRVGGVLPARNDNAKWVLGSHTWDRCLYLGWGVIAPRKVAGGSEMSTEQKQAVVRRFMKETLAGGNVEVIDELLAPNYAEPCDGGMDRGGFKGALAAMAAAIASREFEIEDLVAEGDAVVATLHVGVHISQWREDRGPGSHLTYGLANGKNHGRTTRSPRRT